MAEIDSNGPMIEVGIDTRGIEEGAKKADTSFGEAIHSINEKVKSSEQNFKDFGEVMKSVFDRALHQQADYIIGMRRFDKAMEDGRRAEQTREKEKQNERKETQKQAELEGKRHEEDLKRKQQDEERKQQEVRRKAIDYEKKRREEGKAALEQNKQMIASFRNMALAASTVVTAGMGIREMLNFTNDLARMDLAIKTFGMNAERFFQVRNLMREGGIQDSETFAMEDTMSHAFRTARERGGMGLLNEGQIIALNKLSNYRPNLNPLTARNEDGSRMNFAQWQKEMMIAMSKFYHDKSISLSDDIRIEIMSEFTKNKLIAQRIAELTPEQIAREDEKARREAANLQKNRENNAKVQELKTSLETNVVDLLAKMSPEITSIIESINKFADNPENVKLLAQALHDLGGVLLELLKQALSWSEWFGVKTPDSIKKLIGIDPNSSQPYQMPPVVSKKVLDFLIPERKVIGEKLGGLSEMLFPSAHAETISYQSNLKGRGVGGKADPGKVKAAFDILTQKDQYGSFSGEQAKGIIANLMGESFKSLDHQVVGDGGAAYGLAQWHSNRQADFKRVFGHDIRQSTFAEQVQFLKWEMQNTEKPAGDKIRKTIDADEATIASVKYYERPSDIAGQSIERMRNIATVNRALQHSYMQRPNTQQLQAQVQAQKIINARTANSGDSNYNVNIHVNNGNPQHIAQAFEQKVRQIQRQNKESEIKFMNPDPLNGISGIS